jgi:hypothetical protein
MLSNLSLINQLSIYGHFNFDIDNVITYCKKGNTRILKLNELCVFSDNSCGETKDISKILSRNIVLGSINNCTQILGQVSKTYLWVSEMQSVVLRKVDMFSLSFPLLKGVSKDLNFTRHILSQKNVSPQQHPLLEQHSCKYTLLLSYNSQKTPLSLSFIFVEPTRPIATFTVPHTWTIIWITQI